MPRLPDLSISARRPAHRRGRFHHLTTADWPEGLFCNVAAKLSADHFNVALKDLSAVTRRSPQVAHARQVAMYLAHVAFGIPLANVAACFGRDRTTVSHACHRIEDRRDDPAFDASLLKMEFAAAIMRGLHTGGNRS
jgi:hypothetical protein